MPIVISINPNTPATKPLKRDLSDKPQMVEKPNKTNIKISAGPNLIANVDIKSTSKTMISKLTRPPIVETTTAVPKAMLASPFLVIA